MKKNYAQVKKNTGEILGVYADVEMGKETAEYIVKLLKDDEEYIEIPDGLTLDNNFRKVYKYDYEKEEFVNI